MKTYKTLCRQYLDLKIQQEQNYYLLCTGQLTKEQHSLLSIHLACQMRHLESELNELEQPLPSTDKTRSLGHRLFGLLF